MTSTAPSAGTLAHLPTDWAARHTDWGLGAHVGDQTALLDLACVPGARPLVLAVLAGALPVGAQVLAVTATTREADDLAAALAAFLDPALVEVFPSWETLPHERLSPRNDTVGRRLAVLRRLAHADAHAPGAAGPLKIVVAPVRAVLQPIARGLGDLTPVALAAGDERPLERVVEDLVAAAYSRTDLVERRGEFAVRGGILDVFPPTEEHPLRVEFWGDTVEEIRWFRVADQRSLEVAEGGLWAPPCREVLLTDDVRERARDLASRLPGVADLLDEGRRRHRRRGHGVAATGPRRGHADPPRHVLGAGSLIVLADPERIRTRAHDLVATSEEFLEASWSNAAAGNAVPIDLRGVLDEGSYRTLALLRQDAITSGMPWWSLTAFASDAELTDFLDDDTSEQRLDLGCASRTPIAATPRLRWPTSVAGSTTAGPSSQSPKGRVSPDGCVEVLAERGIPSRLSSTRRSLAPASSSPR
jgi:transcription-repair coupling factor (superfamily II helicase)